MRYQSKGAIGPMACSAGAANRGTLRLESSLGADVHIRSMFCMAHYLSTLGAIYEEELKTFSSTTPIYHKVLSCGLCHAYTLHNEAIHCTVI